MQEIVRMFRTTIIGGVVFIVPLVLVFIILKRVFQFIKKIIQPFLPEVGATTIGGVTLHAIIAIIIVLLLCFAAGLIARTKKARSFLKWIETTILEIVPGYKFMKGMGMATAGLDEQDMKVVLARVDDGWQISFLIEQINENMYTVYIPGAPSPWSGSIYHLEKDKIIWTDITQRQAIKCIKQLGSGYKDILNKKLGAEVR